MQSRLALTLALGTFLAWTPALAAQPAQPDLQKQLKDTEIGAHWIYDDIPKGFAEAKRSGKPLFVLFR